MPIVRSYRSCPKCGEQNYSEAGSCRSCELVFPDWKIGEVYNLFQRDSEQDSFFRVFGGSPLLTIESVQKAILDGNVVVPTEGDFPELFIGKYVFTDDDKPVTHFSEWHQLFHDHVDPDSGPKDVLVKF